MLVRYTIFQNQAQDATVKTEFIFVHLVCKGEIISILLDSFRQPTDDQIDKLGFPSLRSYEEQPARTNISKQEIQIGEFLRLVWFIIVKSEPNSILAKMWKSTNYLRIFVEVLYLTRFVFIWI